MNGAILLAQGQRSAPPPDVFILIGVLVFSAVVAILLVSRSARRRQLQIDRLLQDRGFAIEKFNRKNAADRDAAFAPFSTIKWLKGGAKGLKWMARGRLAGRAGAVAAHQYVVYTGHGGHAVTHAFAAVLCDPACAGWPIVTITRKRGWLLNAKARAAVVETGDAAFDKRYRVQCADPGFAAAVLSPAVRGVISAPAPGSEGWILAGPEWWIIGGAGQGVVCLGRQISPKPELLERMMDRVEQFVQAMDEPVRAGLGA